MAYVDLVSTGLTPVAGGSTYNFSYDTPISADGSPHITHIGWQMKMKFDAVAAPITTIGRLISNMRIKIGADTIVDFNDPAPANDGTTPANISVLAQKVRGVDSIQYIDTTNEDEMLGELTLPFGLDASRSHRVNFTITLLPESGWSGGANFTVADTEFNVVHYYGTAADSTLYGSRQDFTLTANAQRAVTIYGKQGWQMLGVSSINSSDADSITEMRVNNGAFRALTVQQWRVLDSTYLNGIRAEGAANAPAWVLSRAGYVFLDLKRITAGANIDIVVTSSANTTVSFFPVWVASLNARTAVAPSQTIKTVSSTAKDVESESYN